MRYLMMLLTILVLLAAACGDGGGGEVENVPATATPPSVGPTSNGETGGIEGFRALAQLIEQAIAQNDSSFFVERAVLEEITCTGEEQLGPCAGQPAGKTLAGVPGSVWQSGASSLSSLEEYAQSLDRYFAAALSDASDTYGPASLTLYALAREEVEGGDVFQAITTSIIDTYPTGAPIGMAEREVHAFNFVFEAGRWQFVGERVAVTSVASSDWLSGDCDACYDEWERWPAAALESDPDPAVAAATAVAEAGGFLTPDEAIEAYGAGLQPALAGDCDAFDGPAPGFCILANRTVTETTATYRLCRLAACLLVALVRQGDGLWTLSSVIRYGEGPSPTEELVP